MINVPVLYLVFNRPDHTRQSFDSLRKIKPKYLFIGADGPRKGNKIDEIKCAEVRDIVSKIDWECKPQFHFNEKNLGTKVAVSNAINWFFRNVEEGVIMEDDCIPDATFYSYAAEMLTRYRYDDRIMHINGTNFLKGAKIVNDSSYYFSNFCHVWGWATWRRAWQHYDVSMMDFHSIDKEELRASISIHQDVSDYWYRCLEAVYHGKIDTWDYQWYYAFWKNQGYAITPSMNMISNIGFDESGTRTISKHNRFSKMKRFPMNSIIHPASVKINERADNYASAQKFKELTPSILEKVHYKWKLILKDLKRDDINKQ